MSREAVDRMTQRLVQSGTKHARAREIAVREAKRNDRDNKRPIEIKTNVRK